MKALTANRLTDGEAVWYAAGAVWAETFDAAEVAHDKAGEDRLEVAGKAAHKGNEVVDINLIDLELANGIITPKRLRERIRARGPTNRTDLGKQARTQPGEDKGPAEAI